MATPDEINRAIEMLNVNGYVVIYPDKDVLKLLEGYPLKDVMLYWCAYKKEKKKKYTPMGLRRAMKDLLEWSGNNTEIARSIIENSIRGNYDGFFKPNNRGGSTATKFDAARQVAIAADENRLAGMVRKVSDCY